MEDISSGNPKRIRLRFSMRTVQWTVLWTVLWTVMYCGEVSTSAAGCPVVSGGRVICLQSQLCAPGRPLPGPGCGPRRSHVCCLKGRAAGGPLPGPVPKPPAAPPGVLQPWRPDQPPEPWKPEHVEPWKSRPTSPGPWRPSRPGVVIPDVPPGWQSDLPAPPVPTPPPLPATVAPPVPTLPPVLPSEEPLPPALPSAEPLLQCGREQPGAGRRRRAASNLLGVTGGQDATRQRWPWAALLGERETGGARRWFCGAVLVGRRALVTAAHCVSGRKPAQLLVRLGEYDLSTAADGRTRRQPIGTALRSVAARYTSTPRRLHIRPRHCAACHRRNRSPA